MDIKEFLGIPNPDDPSFRDILYNLDLWLNPEIYARGVDISLTPELNQLFHAGGSIENAAIYHPEVPRQNSFDSLLAQSVHSFLEINPDLMPTPDSQTGKAASPDPLRAYFEDKYILGTTAYAGLGHFKELTLLMKKIGAVSGVGAWMFQPEQCLPETNKAMFAAKIKLYSLLQTETLDRESMNEILTDVLSKSPHLLDKISAVVGHGAMDMAMGATGYLTDRKTFINRLAIDLVDILNKKPGLAKAVMNMVAMLDINISESKLPKVITTVLELMEKNSVKPELIATSYPANLRALINYLSKHPDVYPSGRVFSFTPDSGYAEEEEELVKSLAYNNLEIFTGIPGLRTNAVHCSPSEKVTTGFREVFNNRGPIVTTGELLDSITVAELAQKWNMNHRNVGLMVNGNASNAGVIRRAVKEFLTAGCPKDITLAVCIFKHDPGKIFGEDWPEIQRAIAYNSKQIKLVRVGNSLDAAFMSQQIPKWAHMIIGKPPGENSFMSAASGCLEACAYSPVNNEQHNMLYNLDKALMCTYPPTEKDRWKKFLQTRTPGERSAAKRGLDITAGNFVDYIRSLDKDGFARQFALEGYVNSEHLNTLHIVLVKLVQMLDGGLSQQRHEQIIDFMAITQAKFNDDLELEFQKYFKLSFKGQKQLPNKYEYMDRQLRKTEPEVSPIDKTAKFLFAATAAAGAGVLIYKVIEALNKRKKEKESPGKS